MAAATSPADADVPADASQHRLLQFAPFTSKVSPEFWHEFASLKVNRLQLSDEDVPLVGSYAAGRQTKDQAVSISSALSIEGKAFDVTHAQQELSQLRVPAQGKLKNFNTIEAFRHADKVARFHDLAHEVRYHASRTMPPGRILFGLVPLPLRPVPDVHPQSTGYADIILP